MITVFAQSTAQQLASLPVLHVPLWALRPEELLTSNNFQQYPKQYQQETLDIKILCVWLKLLMTWIVVGVMDKRDLSCSTKWSIVSCSTLLNVFETSTNMKNDKRNLSLFEGFLSTHFFRDGVAWIKRTLIYNMESQKQEVMLLCVCVFPPSMLCTFLFDLFSVWFLWNILHSLCLWASKLSYINKYCWH